MAQRVVIPGFRKIETSGGGEGGTSNYNDLTNKPSINNVPLVGKLNTVDLKLTDATLTEEGVPADAKKVGTKLEEQSTSLTKLSEQLGNHTVKSDVPENAVFTDTIYDDTEVKESIDELSSNLDTLCKTNLIDKSVRYDGYYANDNKYYNNISGFCIYIIKVVPNTDIIMSGFSSKGAFCAYLNSQNVEDVKQSAWNIEDNNGTHTIPSDVHYVGICCNTADVSADIKAIGFVECANEINDINESLEQLPYNLIDLNKVVSGKKFDTSDAAWSTSDYIYLKGQRTLSVCGKSFLADNSIEFYGESKNTISKVTKTWKNITDFPIPDNAFYCRITIRTYSDSNDLSTVMLCYGNVDANASYKSFNGNPLFKVSNDVDEVKNDLDKLNALPIGTIIQIEADKDTIATTEAKYSWQYLGTSNIQYENGGATLLVTNVYRKNN